MSRNDDDYDSPWKTILETYFEAFMRFFFPHAADDIDWSRPYQFLDKELQQVVRDADLGRRYADKLVQVWRRSGAEAWVLAHVEVQGEPEPDFAKRMFVYNYRIFDRYDRPVASMAVLADDRDGWRPDHYGYALWGSEMVNRFAMVKLIDFQDRLDAIAGSDNPFAVVTLAHLTARRTRHDDQARFSGKLQLIKSLYRRGWEREQILALFHFIDWLLRLPEGLENLALADVPPYGGGPISLAPLSWIRRRRFGGRAYSRWRTWPYAFLRRVNPRIAATASRRMNRIMPHSDKVGIMGIGAADTPTSPGSVISPFSRPS